MPVRVGSLLAGDFVEKGRHGHTRGDKTCPSNMHGDQKLDGDGVGKAEMARQ